MTEAQKEYIIMEELAELIEGQLKNEHCKKCPYEGAGVNSGILANLRMRKVTRMSGGNLLVDKPTTKSEAVLEEAISICQNLYEHHYDISVQDHIEGYDDDDQKEVKQNHWIRACGISETIPKLKELRSQQKEREQK